MNKTGKIKALITDSLIFALGSLGSKFILFILLPLYTHYLSPAEYGIADLVFTFSQLLEPFVSVVIFDAVIRFGLMKSEKPAEVLKCAFFVLLIGSLSMAVLTPAIGLYSEMAPWKWYLCIYVILHCIYAVELNYLKIQGQMKEFALISLFSTAAMAGLNLLLLTVCRMGIRGYLLANILSIGASCLWAFSAGNMLPALLHTRLNASLLKRMLLFSTPLILNNISNAVIHSTDKVMIGGLIGAGALGIYTIASKLPSLINVVHSIFSQAWGLSAIREMESDNDKRFYTDVFRVYSCLIVLWCMLLIAFIKPFMAFYVAEGYQSAWQFIPMLLVSAAFSAFSSFFGRILSAMNKTVISMNSTLAGAVLNIVLNFIGIRCLGIWGAVLSTVSCYLLMFFIKKHAVCRQLGLSLSGIHLAFNGLLLFVQAAAVSVNYHAGFISFLCLSAFVFINHACISVLMKKILEIASAVFRKLKK